ncbi:MAG: hypothetical protein AAGA70_14510 [Pseudomonadota bacterium]
MRREHDLDDAGIVLIVIALVLMMAAIVSIAKTTAATERAEGPFVFEAVERPSVGFSLISGGSDREIRTNQLPQVN